MIRFSDDRDSLYELFDIVSERCENRHLPMTYAAFHIISESFSCGADVYLRRRLSVCRMLCDMHLPLSDEELDIMLGTALCHSLPGDTVPPDYTRRMKEAFSAEPRVAEVFSALQHVSYDDKDYYNRVIHNRYALMIRLTERGVLVETLYEWPVNDAFRFIYETRDYFFPMCLYGRDQYPEFAGQINLLMEKMRNLITINEILLNRYRDTENAMRSEIVDLMEENAFLIARIKDFDR